MRQPQNNYRYTVTNILGTISDAATFGEGSFRLEWSQFDSGPYDYSKKLPSKIVFRESVYSNLLSLEITTLRCEPMTLTVERFCGGAWIAWFSGRFNLNDAGWNL